MKILLKKEISTREDEKSCREKENTTRKIKQLTLRTTNRKTALQSDAITNGGIPLKSLEIENQKDKGK